MKKMPKLIIYFIFAIYILIESFAAFCWVALLVLYLLYIDAFSSQTFFEPSEFLTNHELIYWLINTLCSLLSTIIYFGGIILFILAFIALGKILIGKKCNKFYSRILFITPPYHYLVLGLITLFYK